MNKIGFKHARFGEKGRRLQRSWETLILLSSSEVPLSAKEINEKTHKKYPFNENKCSVQTTREDLKLLIECGFPVIMTDKNGNKIDLEEFEDLRGKFKNTGYLLSDPLKTSEYNFSPSSFDIITLAISRAAAESDLSEKFYLKKYFTKMNSLFYEKINERLKSGKKPELLYVKSVLEIGKKYSGEKISEKVLEALFEAIARNQVLEAKYINRNNEEKESVFLPLRIWISQNRLYLITAGAPSGKYFTWRIDKFKDIKEVKGIEVPEINRNEVDEIVNKSFGGFTSEPETIKLKVMPEAAYLFEEFSYHSTQKILENKDKTLDVEITAPINWALEEWILGFGEFVIVVSPDSLKKIIKDRIFKSLQNYDNF
ncbi:MAG: WYL domain-containing protein [Desulforegulaceae bacterium]|nr:WYL domain-containing protein [Desulforegulaceae bacterium]